MTLIKPGSFIGSVKMRYYFGKPRPRTLQANAHTKRLLVRCPETARLAETGQTIEEEDWVATKLRSDRLICPHCQKVHIWTKKDVVLAR